MHLVLSVDFARRTGAGRVNAIVDTPLTTNVIKLIDLLFFDM